MLYYVTAGGAYTVVETSFNPCFNGTYSLTVVIIDNIIDTEYVLILVLMELILLLFIM